MNNFVNLETLINQFNEDQDNKKIIIIAGKRGVKKTYLLSKIWNYSYNNFKFEPKSDMGNLNRFLVSYFSTNLVNIDYSHPYHRTTQKFTLKKLSDDLGYTVLSNLKIENISSWSFLGFIKKTINYMLIKKVQYKVHNIKSSFSRINFFEKNKTLWPVLTTITSIGTSIGTPVLSLILFRQDALTPLIGKTGIQAIIAICGILIASGVFSVLWYLITNILSTRKVSFNDSLVKKYQKILKKHFYLPSKNTPKRPMWKFAIKSSINYFYDDLNLSDDVYPTSISLMHILRNFNSNVIANVNVDEEYQVQNVYLSYLGNKENSFIYDIAANYKENNNSKITKFLLEKMSKIFKVNLFFLYRRNFLFANFINTFVDYSNASWQFFQFLEDLKNYVGEIPNLYKDKKYLEYFIHILPFLILKSINNEDYIILKTELKNSFKLPKLIQKKYEILKFDFILQESWKRFKTFSLLFRIEAILDENKKVSEIVQDFSKFEWNTESIDQRKKSLINKFQSQKFVDIKNPPVLSEKYNVAQFVNDYEELLLIIDLYNEHGDIGSDILEIVLEIKKIGVKANASYLVLLFKDSSIFLQKNHNDYEIADMFQ